MAPHKKTMATAMLLKMLRRRGFGAASKWIRMSLAIST